ncbi:MAG: hypothetical protein ACI4A3_04170, partial [Lachnospiraceae bacterium]
RAEGRAEGCIEGEIKMHKRFGKTKDETKNYLAEEYHLTEDEVAELINKHWDNIEFLDNK